MGEVIARGLKEIEDVTRFYERAEEAAKKFNPGEQPDIGKLMRAAFKHGYAAALRDMQQSGKSAEQGK